MRLTMGSASHVGRVRAVNEDSCLADGRLAAVADGMGGHACGDVASGIAIDALRSLGEADVLRANDIECTYRPTQEEDSPFEGFGSGGMLEILVHPSDLEAARALLEPGEDAPAT